MSYALPATAFDRLQGDRAATLPPLPLPETTIKLVDSRNAMQLVVTQGSCLNGATIFAWVEAIRPFPLAIPRKPILTLEAPIADCRVRRDGFGGVTAHVGYARFVIDESDARTLETLHSFTAIDGDD